MNEDPLDDASPQPEIPLLLAAELQDSLMTASNDLDRLHRLLADASDALMAGFQGAAIKLDETLQSGHGGNHEDHLRETLQTLHQAVAALQFQDLASQLIHHTNKRLRNCADQLARDALGDDDPDGMAVVESGPLRPNPVTQDEMDAGSVELF